jgi:hypothetical protein
MDELEAVLAGLALAVSRSSLHVLEVVVIDFHLGELLLHLSVLKQSLLEGTKPDSVGRASLFDFSVEESARLGLGHFDVRHAILIIM